MDKVAVEIFRNQFEGVVEEMGHSIMRAGHTVFVKETADFSACLVTPGSPFGTGAEVFAAHSRIGIWLQVGWPVDDCLKALGDLHEGDICIANDPVSTGGLSTHLPDIFAWKPIFFRGELMCLGWTFIHFTDVSGMVGGSVAMSAAVATVTRKNFCLRIPATICASPPLLPGPASTSTSFTVSRHSPVARSAAAAPARSMSGTSFAAASMRRMPSVR